MSMSSGRRSLRSLRSLRSFPPSPNADDPANDTFRLVEQLREKEAAYHNALMMTIETYKTQLGGRPPLEAYHKLQRERQDLEFQLQCTLNQNEKYMTDLERSRDREKLLERELTRLSGGDNWKANVEIDSPPLSILSSPESARWNYQRPQSVSSPTRNSYSPSQASINSPMSYSIQEAQRPSSGSRPAKVESRSPIHESGVDLPTKSEMDPEAQRLATMKQLQQMILGLEKKLDAHQGRLKTLVDGPHKWPRT